ncbi:MAG TPA: Wzz/FepE/Etk N-terminal domain-containing protein [Chthoniobacterales bacterium]|nr:Wzz/FepE/Etk N-terminal domain-containing protein [Chthoniobacterales bacterium]
MATEVSVHEGHEKTSERLRTAEMPKEDREISLLDLLLILAERKRLVLSITIGFALVGAIVSLLLPKRYTATSSILPPQQNSSMGAALASQLGNLSGIATLAGGSLGMKNPNDMIIGLMKSRTVEDAMVQQFGLQQEYRAYYPSDARKNLEKHTMLDGSSKDGLIRLSIEDRDPIRAAQLVNGYVNQFRKLSEHLAITEAAQRRLFFQEQLEEAKNNLANAEEALKRTEQQTGLIQLDSQARALIESATSLRAAISAKEVQLHALQSFATDQNAQIIQAQQELDALRTQLAKLGGSEDNSDAGLIVPKGKVPGAGLEYLRKLRDVKYYETIFEILARQFEMAKLDEAKQGALIQVVDAAVVPDKRSSPKRTLIILGSTAFGLIMGVFAALIQAMFQRMNEDSETQTKLHSLFRFLSLRERTI